MPSDGLFDLAFALKKEKLWKKMSDTELFAVRLADGETGYCVLMGMMGEHMALAVYPGGDGLDSYRILAQANNARRDTEAWEAMLSQDCLQCSFENAEELDEVEMAAVRAYARTHGIQFRGPHAFPQFTCYRPSRMMWPLEGEKDEERLCEALRAALEVARRLSTERKSALGLREGEAHGYDIPLLTREGESFVWSMTPLPPQRQKKMPSPSLENELMLARLRKAKKNRRAWLCELFLLPSPMTDQEKDLRPNERPKEAPWYPHMLLAVDSDSGMILSSEMVPNLKRDAVQLIDALALTMSEEAVPAEILVRDERTRTFLQAFADQTGIRLTQRDELPLLDEAVGGIMEHMMPDEEGEEDTDAMRDEIVSVFTMMSDVEIKAIPAAQRKQLRAVLGAGVFPPALEKRLRDLL